ERSRYLVGAPAIIPRDDRRHALHQVVDVRAPLRAVARQVFLRVRVGIDEAGRDDEASGIDRPARRDVRPCGVADERDPAAGDRDVGGPGRRTRTVDDPTIADEKVWG